jgi:hypothetical protein
MSKTSNVVVRLWAARSEWLLLSILGASLLLNIELGWRVRDARFVRAAPALQVGATVPVLTVEDLRGARATINWAADGRSTLVYVFSPSCHWCTRNLPNIKALIGSVGSAYRVLGISISKDGLDRYVRDNNFALPIYLYSSEIRGRQLSLETTPQTFIVSPRAKITELWTGAYVDPIKNEIESKLGLRLPGLVPDAKKLSEM